MSEYSDRAPVPDVYDNRLEASGPPPAAQQLADICNDAYSLQTHLNPADAAAVGDACYDARFPDIVSMQYPYPVEEVLRDSLFMSYHQLLGRLALVETSTLTPNEHTAYQRLVYNLTMRSSILNNNTDYLRPVDSTVWSTPEWFKQDMAGTGRYSIQTERDVMAAAFRASDWKGWVQTAIHNMRRGVAIGDTQPQAVMAQLLRQIDNLLQGDTVEQLYVRPLRNIPNLSERVSEMYQKMMQESVGPGYEMLYSYIQQDYLAAARSDEQPGLCYIPNGLDQYERIMESWSGEQRSVSEVHKEAIEEYYAVTAELDVLARRLGHDTVDSLVHFIYNDPSLMVFASQQEIQQRLEEQRAIIVKNAPHVFGPLPADRSYNVHLLSGEEGAVPTSYYQDASTDGRRRGSVYVGVGDPTKYTWPRLLGTSVHEAGHHFPMTVQKSLDVPRFLRDFSPCYGYREAVAMHAQQLAEAWGIKVEDYDRVFHLVTIRNCWRGVVLDTGLHGLGWSVQKTLETRRAMGGSDGPAEAQQDVRRFMQWPGQVGSFTREKVVSGLRARAETRLGAVFDQQQFYSMIVGSGEMELDLLTQKANAWIEEQSVGLLESGF